MSFVARLSLLFLLLAVILLAVGLRVWQTTDRFLGNNNWVAHTYEVKERTATVLARLGTLQADAAAFAVTGESLRLSRVGGQVQLLESDLKSLVQLVHDNPAQTQRVGDFAKVVLAQRDAAVAAVESRRQTGNTPVALPGLALNQVSTMAGIILDEEDTLLIERRVDSERSATQTKILTGSAILLSLFFLALTFWLMRQSHLHNDSSRDSLRTANAQLADALAETQRVGESMQKLGQFNEMLQSCHSLDEVREGIRSAMTGLLPDLGGHLALINPSQNLTAVGAHWGRHGLIVESIFPPEDCWALRRGHAYPQAGIASAFTCKHVHWPNPDMPEAAYLCVPLAAQGEMIGVLTFDGERPPTPSERRVALAASEQLALALANLRLQDTLRTQSIRDPLTGLFNRRYLEVSLERELLRAARRALPLSVLMLDVDDFKRFNDTHGHEAGDTLLSRFAEVLKRTTRPEDIACRYGGEEFTVVMQEADEKIAVHRAEQVRMAIAEMSVEHRREQLPHVTVSIGYAVYPRDGSTQEDLLRRADAGLYLAKRSGRNRVASAREEPVPDLVERS